MDVWQFSLIIGALLTAGISYNNPRGIVWVLLGAANFIAGCIYDNYGLPHPAVFVLTLDVIFCIIIDIFRKYDWELQLYRLFKWSAYVSAATIFELKYMDELYVPILEVINWAALFVVSLSSLIMSGLVGTYVANHIIITFVFARRSAHKNSAMEKARWHRTWK